MEVKIINNNNEEEIFSGNINQIEVVDEEHKHRFIFTQGEDNGVFVKILPYDGKLG